MNGEFQAAPTSSNQAGRVIATVGNVSGAARVRVFSPLPWAENFENGRPPHWIGGGGSLQAVDEGGEQLFRKGPSRHRDPPARDLHRSGVPVELHGAG